MRRLPPLVVLALLVACTGDDVTTSASTPVISSAPPTSATRSATSSGGTVTPSTSATSSFTATGSPVPALPPGLPPIFEDDVASANVPSAALVPLKTEVTGTWFGTTSAGEAIVVAWQVPGDDPFRLARGLAVWRRFDDGGAPWRPVFGAAWAAKKGLLAITGLTAEVTGDGSDDAIVQLETGGSGGCARWLVVELATGEIVWDDEGCDRRIEPHAGPAGLVVTEAVYEPGDPHCCPSAFRETVWTFEGDARWDVASENVTEA